MIPGRAAAARLRTLSVRAPHAVLRAPVRVTISLGLAAAVFTRARVSLAGPRLRAAGRLDRVVPRGPI